MMTYLLFDGNRPSLVSSSVEIKFPPDVIFFIIDNKYEQTPSFRYELSEDKKSYIDKYPTLTDEEVREIEHLSTKVDTHELSFNVSEDGTVGEKLNILITLIKNGDTSSSASLESLTGTLYVPITFNAHPVIVKIVKVPLVAGNGGADFSLDEVGFYAVDKNKIKSTIKDQPDMIFVNTDIVVF